MGTGKIVQSRTRCTQVQKVHSPSFAVQHTPVQHLWHFFFFFFPFSQFGSDAIADYLLYCFQPIIIENYAVEMPFLNSDKRPVNFITCSTKIEPTNLPTRTYRADPHAYTSALDTSATMAGDVPHAPGSMEESNSKARR